MNRPTLAILVPVLNRPANVKPLVESFLTGCFDNASLIFITEVDDIEERQAISRLTNFTRIHELTSLDAHTWPEKINLGVEEVEADWYLFGADDIRFQPGWWNATYELRGMPNVGVIGTNDSLDGTGNPRVAAGEHTCHALVRGDYIRERGTVDGRDAVHPGYHHWCVDDELVWTAKTRGAWAFCREAVVEHLHPYWGTAKVDETYLLGEANAQADMALWQERAKLLGLVG